MIRRSLGPIPMKSFVAICLACLSIARDHRRGGPATGAPATADITVESPPPGAVNLIPNGDFETPNAAGDGPAHWQQIDNLVYHWTRDRRSCPWADPAHRDRHRPKPGLCLVEETRSWTKRRCATRRPKSTTPAMARSAGLDGGFYASDLIPIKAGGRLQSLCRRQGPRRPKSSFAVTRKRCRCRSATSNRPCKKCLPRPAASRA